MAFLPGNWPRSTLWCPTLTSRHVLWFYVPVEFPPLCTGHCHCNYSVLLKLFHTLFIEEQIHSFWSTIHRPWHEVKCLEFWLPLGICKYCISDSLSLLEPSPTMYSCLLHCSILPLSRDGSHIPRLFLLPNTCVMPVDESRPKPFLSVTHWDAMSLINTGHILTNSRFAAYSPV